MDQARRVGPSRLPHEIFASEGRVSVRRQLELTDDAEIAMRRRAENGSRDPDGELPNGVGLTDYQFSGRWNGFRRAGAEDLVLLFSTGDSAPRPARGAMLGDKYSVSVAPEYRGHWARVTRGFPL